MFKNIFIFIEKILFWLASVALISIMLLVSIDVLARYLFSAPLEFQFQLTTNYLMVIVATLALPWCQSRGSFISISILSRFLSIKGRNLLFILNSLLICALILAISWFSGHKTFDAYLADDFIFGVIDWPVWLSLIWVPVGCLALSLRILISVAVRVNDHGREIDTCRSGENSDHVGEA